MFCSWCFLKILPAACGSRVHPDRLHHEKISSFIFRRHLPPTPLLLRPFIGRRCGIGCRRLSSIRRYPRLSSQTVCRVAWDVRTASYQTYRRGNLEQCASHYCRIKANNKLMRLMIWIGSMKTIDGSPALYLVHLRWITFLLNET